MAYSDYGAFVHQGGERRCDKEDVGVYDTDEAALPSGARIFANLIKNRKRGTYAWWQHSHHGVMGDGPVRVGCYKQGLPSSRIYFWPDGTDIPQEYRPQELTGTPPLPIPQGEYKGNEAAWDAYWNSLWNYDYGHFGFSHDFGTGEYRFTFTDKETSRSGHFEATMTEPDGTRWECAYDYGYGAGLTDDEPDGKHEVFQAVVDSTFREA